MKAQEALQKCLHARFLELQARNPSFSLRAFAKKLGVSPSAASELLRGQRRASRKLAERMITRLLLDPQEAHQVLQHFEVKKAPRSGVSAGAGEAAEARDSREYLRLTADQFQLIGEWVHYAILSLSETDDFQPDSVWIARRLGVPVSKVEACLVRLERLGLLERTPEGALRRTFAQVHTPDDVFNASLQKAHIADMEIAKNAIQNVPVGLRDFTSITMPTSPELLPELKKLIRKFRQDAVALMESAPRKSEVYQMSVYAYPLTKISEPKDLTSTGKNSVAQSTSIKVSSRSSEDGELS